MRDKEDTLLIAFLGAQKIDKKIDNGKEKKSYTETTYAIPGEEPVESIFSFESIIATKGVSKLVLVGTKGSCWYDVCNEFMTDKDKDEDENEDYLEELKGAIMEKKEPNLLGIEGAIRSKYPDIIEVKPIIIENGKEESELEDTFVKLTQLRPLMDNGVSRIIIDITNGFRSIPIHTFLFTKYMDKLINSNISYEIYYGMFEANEKITPVVNLAVLNELMQWIEAINEFRTTGSVDSLNKLINDLPLAQSMKNFREGTDTNSLEKIYRSVQAIKRLSQEGFEEFKNNTNISQGVKQILLTISEEFCEVFTEVNEGEEVHSLIDFQLKLAYWYYSQNKIGLSTSIAMESLISILSYTVYKSKDEIFSYKYRDKIKNNWISWGKSSDLYKEVFCAFEALRVEIRNIFAHCGIPLNPTNIEDAKDNLAKLILGSKWIQKELYDLAYIVPFSNQIVEELGSINFVESDRNDVEKFKEHLKKPPKKKCK